MPLELIAFLPTDAVIAEEKLTRDLFVHLPKDNSSKFLSQAGYTLDNWQQPEQDLRTQVLTQSAELVEINCDGEKYSIRACL